MGQAHHCTHYVMRLAAHDSLSVAACKTVIMATSMGEVIR